MRIARLADIRPTEAVSACYAALDGSAPDDYRQLAALLVDHWRCAGVVTVGIGGGQGAGKSTLSALLRAAGDFYGIKVAVLGIDDFYLTKAERRVLARDVHPLFATRGPPGTHAVERAGEAVAALGRGESVAVPRFDKGKDDRAGIVPIEGPVDIVVLEGWCVGAPPRPDSETTGPLNDLERVDDADGRWRGAIEEALASRYAVLFDALDAFAFLAVPDLDAVRRWRAQQERERPPGQRMTGAEVARFVAHYERITRRMLAMSPQAADVLVELAEDHSVRGVRFGPR